MEPNGGSLIVDSIDDELARRSIRSTFIEVLDYAPSSAIPASQLAPPGTIAVYLSLKGAPLLKEVREAARTPKGGRDRKLIRRIMRAKRLKPPMAAAEAARRIRARPVLANLNYGGSTMVRHLFAETEDDLYITVLPYAGGPLIDNGFRLDEFMYEDDDEPLECVLIKNDPALSPAEKAALKKLPPELQHAYVSPLDTRAATPLAAAALYVVVWGFVAATYTLVKARWDESLEHINPQALESLGPTAAVRALLQMRIDILKNQAEIQQAAHEFGH